jgi:hypothetical protein
MKPGEADNASRFCRWILMDIAGIQTMIFELADGLYLSG